MRSKLDPLHPSNIAKQKRKDRKALRIIRDPHSLYSRHSIVGYVGPYSMPKKFLPHRDKDLDERGIIMLKAIITEYRRTGINKFTKAECERLACGKSAVKWARNRFKILLQKGYLMWVDGEGVMINFDLVMIEDEDGDCG